MTGSFALHKQLEADTSFITELDLCLVQLINDANYPWTVLVPKRVGATEIYKLHEDDQIQLAKESALLSKTMELVFKPDKLNVAAIGNRVPQLHIHHIARYKTDIAWPAPVWGFAKATPYPPAAREQLICQLQQKLNTQLPT